MATADPVGPLGKPIRVHEEDYPFWRDNIPPETRRQLVEEDVLASESVAAELLSIFGAAIVLAVAVVLIVCR
jgi:hypothetical protein